jgi:hypothetical protein
MMNMRLLFLCVFVLTVSSSVAQINPSDTAGLSTDTFFLAKKKGIFGKLGRSIAEDPPNPNIMKSGTIRNDLPYNKYKGYTIRHIYFTRLGLDRNFNDTSKYRNNFGVRLGKTFHRTSKERVIRNNLFFEEGDKIVPLLLADNERHLREQEFIQDARFIVTPVGGKMVDVTVITKDLFSIGGNVDISSTERGRLTIREENFLGNGQRLQVSGLYDKNRSDQQSFGGEFTHRNIFGSLANWTIGFSGYNPAFNNGRRQETYFYTRVDKPLVSPYIPWIGGLEASFHQTKNSFRDTLYDKEQQYQFYNADMWIGYNIGSKRHFKKNISTRLRKFIAIRGFHTNFQEVPGMYRNVYYYQYANITGALASLTLLNQSFYKTKYIYGFGGRYEDVPEGFSAALVGGWADKSGLERPYYGLDFQRYYFSNKGNYFNYTFKLGGFLRKSKFEDVDLLLNIDFFSKLKKINSKLFSRQFISLGFTRQFSALLNEPLKLSSDFGIPIFQNGLIAADARATLKGESVLYSKPKILGFGFAPFIFGDLCMLKPVNISYGKSDIFSSIGAGIRTRNETLVFGTMELKAYYFPRTNATMTPWKIEFRTDVRFKYNSQFIRRPEFISSN